MKPVEQQSDGIAIEPWPVSNYLEYMGNVDNPLPIMLSPFQAHLESEESALAIEIADIENSYRKSFRHGRREYGWTTIIKYLHRDQIRTHCPDLILAIHDAIGDVLLRRGKYSFLSVGGESRRLQLLDVIHRDVELSYMLRAYAQHVLKIPIGGNAQDPYEQHARAVVERLVHPYNTDLKLPLDADVMPEVYEGVSSRITAFLDRLQHDRNIGYQVEHNRSTTIFHIPDWKIFWHPPRLNAEATVYEPTLKWVNRSLLFYPKRDDIREYVIRIEDGHRGEGNSQWRAVYVQGGIVDTNGNFHHLNIETWISPLASRKNGLAEIDERSGPRVSSRQNQGVVFDVRKKIAKVPTHDPYNYTDELPMILPADINKLLGLLSRQIQYFALTVEQNDVEKLTANVKTLVSALMLHPVHGVFSPEKAEVAMGAMLLAFMQAPNRMLQFFSVSGLSNIFPRAVRLDRKGKFISLDRIGDTMNPTTEVDPESGTLSWRLDEMGIYMAIIHATGDSYPTMKTKRSIAAEFCWLFDPRASNTLDISLKRQNGKTKL